MSEATFGQVGPQRQLPRMGMVAMIWHHHKMVGRARDQLGDPSIPKPIKVVLVDGSGWNLDSRSGVDWHLSRLNGETLTVTSARVADLSSKMDRK